MSVVRGHSCEFCGTEFLRRLSGPKGAHGSRSTCPSCGKAPTPPAPHPESLRPAAEMFPGLKVERATETHFSVGAVTPEPMQAPRFKIFEMDSMPKFSEEAQTAAARYPPLEKVFTESAKDPLLTAEGVVVSLAAFGQHLQQKYPNLRVREVVDAETGLRVSSMEAIERLSLQRGPRTEEES